MGGRERVLTDGWGRKEEKGRGRWTPSRRLAFPRPGSDPVLTFGEGQRGCRWATTRWEGGLDQTPSAKATSASCPERGKKAPSGGAGVPL